MLILHHFDASPFAEKIRLTLGLKQLSWHSVEIPMIMPKPQLMPLTGGYRRTPVLQIGADIYCDSRLIMQELEQRFVKPSLYPNGGKGLMQALSAWSDAIFFEPGAGLSMGLNEGLPEDLLNDRKEFFNFIDFNTLQKSLPHLYGQYLAQLQVLENELSDNRIFLTGNIVSGIDILSYFPLWMARGNFPQIEDWMSEYPNILKWETKMQAIGHGEMLAMSPEEALAIAKGANPHSKFRFDKNPEKLKPDDNVLVYPTDYGATPVNGVLKGLSAERISIKREHPELGFLCNHFPRSGFRVEIA